MQMANFGRRLDGQPDVLPGYELTMVEIIDPEVVTVSGAAVHPIVRPTGNPDDGVEGTVFSISAAELAAADDYEVDDYTRVQVILRSGLDAWVYIQADPLREPRSPDSGLPG
ncbi:gamma-glutamylcyclotransferase [Acrocarpospora pleiomorpha]